MTVKQLRDELNRVPPEDDDCEVWLGQEYRIHAPVAIIEYSDGSRRFVMPGC